MSLHNIKQTIGEGFGNKYLEKLVQIRVAVPGLTRDAIYIYLDETGIIPEVLEILRGGMSNIVQNCGRPDYLAGIGIFLKFKLRMTA